RLIQGSAVSPAIAQSFIHHVVRTFAPELAASGRFLAYIDNLYLKSIENEDENQHIQLVIQLLQALKNANLVINLKKSQLARETWMAVREVLMDIKNLYIPKAEDTLVLRVDAAGAGVGGVLLAQANAEDDQDVRVVAYYSKAFDGQQGSRPSWWLEAYGAKEAVAALYHIIAGRPNVFIETDSSTVLSIHNSDRDPNTHDLPRFAAELSSLGIQAGNMRHRRG
ncbi:DNA/RNA polymerase, partial [Ramicandelaber brevisporus]